MECGETRAKVSNAAIAKAFGLPRVLRVRRLNNCPLGNVLIETARGRFVIRRLPHRSELELKRTAQFLLYMREHGFPVLVPLTDRSGRYWCSSGEGLWSVHPVREWRLQPLDPANRMQLAAVGEAVARYHLAGKGYRKGAEIKGAPERVWQLWSAVRRVLPVYLTRMVRVIDEEVEYLAGALEVSRLPRGPILLDMDLQRFCFQGDRLRLVLNCDPDCRGPYIFDLANAVNQFCFVRGHYDPSRFEALVRAYDTTRLLALLEWDTFPNALRFSAVRSLCVGLQKVFLDQTEGWPEAEPKVQQWFERLRILRRETEGGFGALLSVMATGYEYRRCQRWRDPQ
ncbi:Homoserine kinase [bacterium HR30]|nr:Homoserine kinase [bacterium HR30]